MPTATRTPAANDSQTAMLAELADSVAAAKLARDKAEAVWQSARAAALKVRRRFFGSDKWSVEVLTTEPSLGYDKAKLDAYFERNGINPKQFLVARAGVKRVLVKPV